MVRKTWLRLAVFIGICLSVCVACTGYTQGQVDVGSVPVTTLIVAPPSVAQPRGVTAEPTVTMTPSLPERTDAAPIPTATADMGPESTPTLAASSKVLDAPTPVPAAVFPAPHAERIQFASGATSAMVTAHLPSNGERLYVLRITGGQYIEIDASTNRGAGLRFAVSGADGTVLQVLGQPHLKAVVPSTQDYYIRVIADAHAVDMTLSVLIPVRIVFDPGSTEATVSGSLAAQGMRSYVLRALAGQTMTVQTITTEGSVRVIVAGADGTVLVSGNVAAGPQLGPLPLSTTQDYLITVVDTGGQGARYSMTVAIPASGLATASPAVETIRLTFAPGATMGVVESTIPAQGTQRVVVGVAAGQWMEAMVPPQQGIELSVAGYDGTVLQQGGGPVFRGVVPTTQDYVVTLVNYGGTTSYRLTVTIPVRIAFAPGSTGALLRGSLLPNEIDRYVIRVLAGQTMRINTPTTSGRVSVAAYGVDGTILTNVAAGGVDYVATVPTTQDYRIDVQAVGGMAAHYALDVTIEPSLGTTSLPTSPRQPPRILAFSAKTASDAAGDRISLAWEATGERAALCPIIDDHWVGCRCLFDVPRVGARVIEPSEIVGHYSGFVLIVDGVDQRVTQMVGLDASCPVGTPSWFFPDPPSMCPGEPALHTWAAAERFERGVMLWLADQDTYYILYDDLLGPSDVPIGPEPSVASLQIVPGPLDLRPGSSPDHRTGEVPPPGYTEPVSGFGLVWRGEVQGTGAVRQRLGWAQGPETGYTSGYQCEVPCGTQRDCYILGPQGTVYHLSYQSPLGYVWQTWRQAADNVSSRVGWGRSSLSSTA